MRLVWILTSVRSRRAQPAANAAAPRASRMGSSCPRQRSTIGAFPERQRQPWTRRHPAFGLDPIGGRQAAGRAGRYAA
eukprot:14128588-Alexandrium_andersonii.AAC.1